MSNNTILAIFVNVEAFSVTFKLYEGDERGIPRSSEYGQLAQICANMSAENAKRALKIIANKTAHFGLTLSYLTSNFDEFTLTDPAGYLGKKISTLRTETQKPLGNCGVYAILFSENFKGTTCEKFPGASINNKRVDNYANKTSDLNSAEIQERKEKSKKKTTSPKVNDVDALITALESFENSDIFKSFADTEKSDFSLASVILREYRQKQAKTRRLEELREKYQFMIDAIKQAPTAKSILLASITELTEEEKAEIFGD